RQLGAELRAAGVRAAVARNDFRGYEKLLLEGGPGFDVIAAGEITSGYDVRRALAKGAKAVQVDTSRGEEGPGIFARLAKGLRAAAECRHGAGAPSAGDAGSPPRARGSRVHAPPCAPRAPGRETIPHSARSAVRCRPSRSRRARSRR